MTGGEHLAVVGPLLRVFSFGTKKQRQYALATVVAAVGLATVLIVLANTH